MEFLAKNVDNLAELRSLRVVKIGFTLVILVITFIVIFGLGRISTAHDSLTSVVNYPR